MKKFLSLVLALVMTMSLVTISAGAEDFTDDSKITYAEAVDVMSAVGVVGGYADGSFNPTAGLSRGAAAKIICNMILGPTTAAALSADTAPYKDVATDNTYAGYIAYCAQQGIISGYTDGTFRPYAPLTGYAFMKMLLGALGYDADVEGYNQPNWSVNVAKQALAIGLDDDLVGDFVGTKAVNREEACLYAFNTLLATMVKYENNSTITVGNVTIQNNSKAEPVTSAIASASNFNPTELDGTMYTLQFAEKSFPNLDIQNETKYGHENRYFTLDGQRISANKVIDKTLATVMSADDVTKLITKGDAKYIGYEMAATGAKLYINGAVQNSDTAYATLATLDAAIGATYEQNGVIIEFIDTSSPKDNKYDVVNVIKKTVYTLTADAATKEVTNNDTQVRVPGVAGMGNFSAANTVKNTFGYEGLVKGDVVLAYTSSGDTFIEKADSITGVVTGKVGGTKVIVDGVEYAQSGINNVNYNAASFADYKNTYTFYLDNDSNIVKAVKETAIAEDYAYVLQSNWVNVTGGSIADGTYGEVRLLKMDGTVAVVKVSKINGSKVSVDGLGTGEVIYNAASDAFVTYKVDANGKYELTTTNVNTTANDSKSVANASGAFVTSPTTAVYGNNNTIFLVNTKTAADPKITVYTGTDNVPNVASATTVDSMVKDGVAKYVYILASASSVTGADGQYVYFPGVKNSAGTYDLTYTYVPETEDGKGDDYFALPAIINGKAGTAKLDSLTVLDGDGSDNADDLVAVKTLYKVATTDSNGYITELDNNNDAAEVAGVTGVSYEAGVMKANTTTYNVNDKTEIYYIDVDGVVTELTYDSISNDKTDAVYVVKATNGTANIVYIKEIISSNTAVTSFKYTVNGGSTETEVTVASLPVSGSGIKYVGSLTAGDVIAITSVSTAEGTWAVDGTAVVTTGYIDADSSIVITVTAENGTTTGTTQIGFFGA